jgi:hypothetical protein
MLMGLDGYQAARRRLTIFRACTLYSFGCFVEASRYFGYPVLGSTFDPLDILDALALHSDQDITVPEIAVTWDILNIDAPYTRWYSRPYRSFIRMISPTARTDNPLAWIALMIRTSSGSEYMVVGNC